MPTLTRRDILAGGGAAVPGLAWRRRPRSPIRRRPFPPTRLVDNGHRFFGAVSRGLAEVVQEAERRWGQPNGYVLGQEASAAFFGGLRYGEGKMYTRNAGDQPVFWQGPSLGFDAGADGDRTMMLVYNLPAVDAIFRRFGGIDGSAYFIGGFGFTALGANNIVRRADPHRTGARLGVNVSYLKFTPRATWNPSNRDCEQHPAGRNSRTSGRTLLRRRAVRCCAPVASSGRANWSNRRCFSLPASSSRGSRASLICLLSRAEPRVWPQARARMLAPLSMKEVVAERDLLRAEHAVEQHRLERRIAALQDAVAAPSRRSRPRRPPMLVALESGTERPGAPKSPQLHADLAARQRETFGLEGELGASRVALNDFDARLERAATDLTASAGRARGHRDPDRRAALGDRRTGDADVRPRNETRRRRADGQSQDRRRSRRNASGCARS